MAQVRRLNFFKKKILSTHKSPEEKITIIWTCINALTRLRRIIVTFSPCSHPVITPTNHIITHEFWQSTSSQRLPAALRSNVDVHLVHLVQLFSGRVADSEEKQLSPPSPDVNKTWRRNWNIFLFFFFRVLLFWLSFVIELFTTRVIIVIT